MVTITVYKWINSATCACTQKSTQLTHTHNAHVHTHPPPYKSLVGPSPVLILKNFMDAKVIIQPTQKWGVCACVCVCMHACVHVGVCLCVPWNCVEINQYISNAAVYVKKPCSTYTVDCLLASNFAQLSSILPISLSVFSTTSSLHSTLLTPPFLYHDHQPPRAPEAALGKVWPTTGHWLWVIKVVKAPLTHGHRQLQWGDKGTVP